MTAPEIIWVNPILKDDRSHAERIISTYGCKCSECRLKEFKSNTDPKGLDWRRSKGSKAYVPPKTRTNGKNKPFFPGNKRNKSGTQ